MKLSVLVTTYNVEEFIEENLNSLLEQSVDFDMEILVSDDASTDSTPSIVKKYENQYPGLIKAVYRTKNVKYCETILELIKSGKGEYFAQVDGDDFLTDKNKLKEQVHFLNSRPDCAICFHAYKSVDRQGQVIEDAPNRFSGIKYLDTGYLLTTNLGPGNCVMVRRNALPEQLPEWLYLAGNHVDYALHFLASLNGKIGYLNKKMSSYRIHGNNITSKEPREFIISASYVILKNLYRTCREKGLKEYARILRQQEINKLFILSFINLSKGRVFPFLALFLKAWISAPTLNVRKFKDFIYMASPGLFYKLKKNIPI